MTPSVATTGSSSLNPAWTSLGVSADGGTVITSSATTAAISYAKGDCKDLATKFAAPLLANGWKQTYATDDAESAMVMVTEGDANIAVVTSKDGDGVLLAVSLTGTAAAPDASAAKPAAKKKDCYDPWYSCDQECDNVGWACKTSCPSITDDCAGACGDTEWSCKQACNKVKWACEEG